MVFLFGLVCIASFVLRLNWLACMVVDACGEVGCDPTQNTNCSYLQE